MFVIIIIVYQANPGGHRPVHDRPGFIALELTSLSCVSLGYREFYQLRVTHGSVNTGQ